VEDLKKIKDMIATGPSGATAKGGELKAIIDMWDATFRELAVGSAKPEAIIRTKRKR
jgi:hypothetical protein